jgi:hypothetical protein
MRRLVLVWLVSLLTLLCGCSVHPEETSGPDGYRDTASPLQAGEWIPDQVTTSGDRSDWRSFELEVPEAIQVSLLVPTNDSKVTVGIYEVHGLRVAETHKPAGVGSNKTVFIQKNLAHGRYYIRVRAHEGGDIGYSLRLDIGGFDAPTANPTGGFDITDLPPE